MRKLIVPFLATALSVLAATPTFDGMTAAIRSNDLRTLQVFLAVPQSANLANGLGATPLHYAALYGSAEALKCLLDAGAKPDVKNQSGATPLVYAAWSADRTRLLVEHGATVNVATNQGITPLMVAASVRGNFDTVKYLLEKGADSTPAIRWVETHCYGRRHSEIRRSSNFCLSAEPTQSVRIKVA